MQYRKAFPGGWLRFQNEGYQKGRGLNINEGDLTLLTTLASTGSTTDFSTGRLDYYWCFSEPMKDSSKAAFFNPFVNNFKIIWVLKTVMSGMFQTGKWHWSFSN